MMHGDGPDEETVPPHRTAGSVGARPGQAPDHWMPRRRVSPDAMAGIRTLNKTNPEYDVARLADLFRVSPEAIRRILRSKWVPSPDEAEARDKRWLKRKQEIRVARTGGADGGKR